MCTPPVKTCDHTVCFTSVLPLLYAMGEMISACEDLHKTTPLLVKIMREHLKVNHLMLTLHHQKTGTISTYDSIGLTEEERMRGTYTIGEGITGRVVETGQTIVVPKIRDEPNFLGRTHNRKAADLDASFICVPIRTGKSVLGTLSVEKNYIDGVHRYADVELLTFIASILAQTVELHLLKYEENVHLESENRRLQNALKERFRPTNIIGDSSVMRAVYMMIEKIAKSRITVLLLGESGVGKELVADAIHYNGVCSEGPLVKFNCAALPESIVESELFGHEKGAFTGAEGNRMGRFEEANNGTIFLDEVGELSLAMQAKLLRVLQERTFQRVGGNKPIRVNIRIIAATNRNLAKMVEEKTFRDDLFYRLNVMPLTIPPLRDRGNDIVTLADHFVTKFARENGKSVMRISEPALHMLMNHTWPGNVRELENAIERAVVLCEGEEIHGYDLPPSLRESTLPAGDSLRTRLEEKLEAVEYEYIVESLRKNKGNISDTADQLGMTRRILGLRMKKYKITYKPFRD